MAASLGIADELVLLDTATDLLRAQVLDLQHTGLDVAISTSVADVRGADLCLFSAGIPRTPSVRTRADLLNSNLPATNDCVGILDGFCGVLITVTNPMDVNNYLLHCRTKIPRERCIGFGGQLDSARFGIALHDRKMGGPAYVLGEHGEHQVPVFSRLGQPVPEPDRDAILAGLRGASMEVIKGKGGTVFGPALHIANLIRMVLSDSRELAVCSAVLDGEYGITGCSLGVPCRIGRAGILAIEEWELDAWETARMNEAGSHISDLTRKAVP